MTTPFLLTKSPKNIGIAILLTCLFGPIGLFYASVSGGLIMTLTAIVLYVLIIYGTLQNDYGIFEWPPVLFVVFGLTFWLINIIWAVIGVIIYNKGIEDEANRQIELWDRLHEKDQKQFVINVNQESPKLNISGQGTTVSSKPSLQEWAKNNPSKSINDYYAKFGR